MVPSLRSTHPLVAKNYLELTIGDLLLAVPPSQRAGSGWRQACIPLDDWAVPKCRLSGTTVGPCLKLGRGEAPWGHIPPHPLGILPTETLLVTRSDPGASGVHGNSRKC